MSVLVFPPPPGTWFDPEKLEAMSSAFDEACRALEDVERVSDIEAEQARILMARWIIGMGALGECNQIRLRDSAVLQGVLATAGEPDRSAEPPRGAED